MRIRLASVAKFPRRKNLCEREVWPGKLWIFFQSAIKQLDGFRRFRADEHETIEVGHQRILRIRHPFGLIFLDHPWALGSVLHGFDVAPFHENIVRILAAECLNGLKLFLVKSPLCLVGRRFREQIQCRLYFR